ncbi:MAG: CDP-alcohol phosphatidyltransferase family protein [Proteobacteria bacterium]|nr:CDP-alcohol phosphatidyltransferase family protein [Pseudomonadota bacterium]
MSALPPDRRPLATRQAGWAQRLAAALARTSITPDQISGLSMLFAASGAALLACWPTWLGLLDCAVCVQLRLLCNLLDGMVAMEGGKGSALGKLWNELPDRVADTVLLVALGYACGAPWLGWLGAVLALATVYVRALGGALGFAQDFRGPQAKPQRMAVLTAACLLASGLIFVGQSVAAVRVLWWAAIVIAVGSLLTCMRRTLALATQLRKAA